MEYTKLVLHLYKRFKLLGQDTLTITPNTRLMIVRGRNGSGKSSLFSELSPLPSDKNDFKQGGYKIVELTFQGKFYVLKSEFINKSPKYSFVCDGEELNPAGIVSTQKLLAFTHFGVTPFIHDIMIGKEDFTDMSIGSRKKLFTSLTKLNIDKVLKNYNKLKESLNLNKLMLKNESKQYQIEKSKLIDPDEYDKIKSQLETYKSLIDNLIDFRTKIARFHVPESSESSMADLRSLLDERKRLMMANYIMLTSRPYNEIVDRKEANQREIDLVKSDLDILYDKIESLNIMYDKLKSSEAEDINEVASSLDSINKEIGLLEGSLHYIGKDLVYSESLFYNLVNIQDDLRELPSNIDSDGGYIYSGEKLRKATDLLADLNVAIHDLSVTEKHYRQRIDDAKSHTEKLTCKSCGVEWRMIDLINLDETNASIEDVVKKRIELTEKFKETQEYITSCREYFDNYVKINNVFKECESKLPMVFNEYSESNAIVSDPSSLVGIINKLQTDKGNTDRLISLKREQKLYEAKIQLLEAFGSKDGNDIKAELVNCNSEIELKQEILLDLQKETDNINYVISIYKTINGIDNAIKLTKENVKEYNLSVVASGILTTVTNDIREIRVKMAELENDIHGQDNILYDLSKRDLKIADIEEEIEVLTIILDELSPKNGLLARTISSFLNNIIDSVNVTLSRIWTYEMILSPIDLETSDLDYKFKLEVEGVSDTADISLASKGQKEAINLAFKLVMSKLLGFTTYPLYLDELASHMDSHHTENISKLVHSFVNESNFSQIYMITHKENVSHFEEAENIDLS